MKADSWTPPVPPSSAPAPHMSDPPDTAYVVSWAYGDGSGYEVVAALPDKDKAEGLLDLLKAASDGSLRNYRIHAVPTLARLFT